MPISDFLLLIHYILQETSKTLISAYALQKKQTG